MNKTIEPKIYNDWRKKSEIAKENIKARAVKLGLPEDTTLKVIEIAEKKGTTDPALIKFYLELESFEKNNAYNLGLPEDTPEEIIEAEKKRMEIINITNGELDESTSWNDIMPYFESQKKYDVLVTAANWWVKNLGIENPQVPALSNNGTVVEAQHQK